MSHRPSANLTGGVNVFGFATYKGEDWATAIPALCSAKDPRATYCFASSSEVDTTMPDSQRTWSVSVSNASVKETTRYGTFISSFCKD